MFGLESAEIVYLEKLSSNYLIIDYKIKMINLFKKNMAETVTLQITEALYQRLEIAATDRSGSKVELYVYPCAITQF